MKQRLVSDSGFSTAARLATDHADGDNISTSLVKTNVDLKRLRI